MTYEMYKKPTQWWWWTRFFSKFHFSKLFEKHPFYDFITLWPFPCNLGIPLKFQKPKQKVNYFSVTKIENKYILLSFEANYCLHHQHINKKLKLALPFTINHHYHMVFQKSITYEGSTKKALTRIYFPTKSN